ncbi:MAG TPA: ABC transporter ATP-binding protein, partial [Novosphingobium sp.]|nr:ABC transporter ATP-binding protein [Novosphingobium sp.]
MTLAAQDLSLPGRLSGVSMELHRGAVTAICGPNGAGKSSLLRCLAGLMGGRNVLLDGLPLELRSARERACEIGYLPQEGEVAWDLKVETLVSLGRVPWRSGAEADRIAIDAAIATVIATMLTRAVVGAGPLYGLRHFALASDVELLALDALGAAAALAGL